MAVRATSTGTICFGLVSIPIKVYSATSSQTVRFSMLHETDKARLRQQLVCTDCGETVERTKTVKGYEYSRDQYVVLTNDELKALEQQTDKSIEIEEFIPIEAVDPVYFDKAQLVGPDKGGARAYRLLQHAMMKAGRVALGRFATRGKQQLVLLRPSEQGLMMHGLFYADEVRSFDEIELGEAPEPKKGEMELAQQLIGQLSADEFAPDKYEDSYRQSVLAAVDRKVAGEEVVIAAPGESKDQIIDLVAALKQSISTKKDSGAAKTAARKPARAKGKKTGATKKKAATRKSAAK